MKKYEVIVRNRITRQHIGCLETDDKEKAIAYSLEHRKAGHKVDKYLATV